ncbi:MAG TPA: sigma-70 family RNA polymerase sigma factor [Luteitalea sp.]|nr:sigma-70 family RNA polymerase sigma factor [Luteitalea sp.]
MRLLLRARRGDQAAIAEIVGRHLGPLTRWAHGRLPRWARTVADTGDLVQEALLQTIRRINGFEPQGHAALQAYLRRAVDNRIKDEFRRIGRRGLASSVDDRLPDSAPSPLQSAMFSDTERRYREGVSRLRESDQRLVVARVELGYSLEQLAALTGRARPDTARVALRRALQRLAVEMARGS